MHSCPYCNSDDILFSIKKNIYVCGGCNRTFFPEEKATIKNDLQKESGLQLFFSYGHDNNAEIVERIKKDIEQRGHHVWIDSSRIRPGDNWRKDIVEGVLNSAKVIAFLSTHSTRNPGVCLDELKIAVCVNDANVKTVLLESEDKIQPPSTISGIQWLDMSDWATIKAQGIIDFEEWYKSKFEELCTIIASDDTAKLNGEIYRLKKILSPNLNRDKEYKLLDKDFYGREWLNKYISNWKNKSSEKALIIYGKPGSGKSAYCVNYSHYNSDVYGCFLCEWDHHQTTNACSIIKTIAFKLATKLPDYRHLILHILAETGNDIDRMKPVELFEYLLSYPLNNLVDGEREIGLIIVDGLDEAENNGQNTLAEVFSYCVNRLPKWMKFIFTSRPEKNVTVHFQSHQSIDIVNDMPADSNDMLQYLAGALKGQLYKVPNKMEVLYRICERSENVFLYAVLLVDEIQAGIVNLGDFNSFPRGLNAFYFHSMKRRFQNQNEFKKSRLFFELLSVSDTIPEFIIMDICGVGQYEFIEQLEKAGSWVVCNNTEMLPSIGLCHKSVRDWLTDPTKSGTFFVDNKTGALRLARYCRNHINNIYAKNHISDFYIMSGAFSELEDVLLEYNDMLDPIWNNWKRFPDNWDHTALLDSFWHSKKRNEYLLQLQREGNTEFALWILELAKNEYGIGFFDKELMAILIDTIHLSGAYSKAVDAIDEYLSNYSIEQISNDQYLSMQQVRKIHYKMFYMPVDQLLCDAISLFDKIDTRFPAVYNELLFLIGGNLGVLSGDWSLSKNWLYRSENFANEIGNVDFQKRNARKLSDCLCFENKYEEAQSIILRYISIGGEISGRYEAYLYGALGNILTCIDSDDNALECYKQVLRFTSAKGIMGWYAHANLGIANVYLKLNNIKEANEFALRANSIYSNIHQEWGLIMSDALLATCESRISDVPLITACDKAITRARQMRYNACISSIEDLCDGKRNFFKLYFL